MIRAAIVEDEPLAARFLEMLLTKTARVEVVATSRDPTWALTVCAEHKPDAVFLDIAMPRIDGLDLAAMLAHLPSPPLIVFTTGHSERASEAFRLNAVDYLLKPIGFEQVLEAVCRLEGRMATNTASIEAVVSPSELPELQDRLPVRCPTDDIVKLIPRAEILAAIHHDRRTWIHTSSEEFATYHSLSDLLTWLGDPPFLRISRDAIVNLQTVSEVCHFGDRLYQVVLGDRARTRIQASRSGALRLSALLRTPL